MRVLSYYSLFLELIASSVDGVRGASVRCCEEEEEEEQEEFFESINALGK